MKHACENWNLHVHFGDGICTCCGKKLEDLNVEADEAEREGWQRVRAERERPYVGYRLL